MRRNIWALGARQISGSFNRVMTAGDFSASGGDIRKLYSAGAVRLDRTEVKKLRAAGALEAAGCRFGNVAAVGDAVLTGETRADVFSFAGALRAEYLECRVLRASRTGKSVKVETEISTDHQKKVSSTIPESGMDGQTVPASLTGVVKAETFESLVGFRLNCEYEFRNVLAFARLSAEELECETLFALGPLAAGSVNADYIYLCADGESALGSVVGTEVTIAASPRPGARFRAIPKAKSDRHYSSFFQKSDGILRVEAIEADLVSVENTRAALIAGARVRIGPLSVVDRVEYSGSIEISPRAAVGEVKRI